MPQAALLLTTVNGLTTMAPNLALSKHVLIQDMISSKLQDDNALKDVDIAKTAECPDGTYRREETNLPYATPEPMEQDVDNIVAIYEEYEQYHAGALAGNDIDVMQEDSGRRILLYLKCQRDG